MSERLKACFEKLILSSRKVFLVDCIGAMLTVFFLTAILAQFEEIFGMPKLVVYYLATIASILAFFSLTCYLINFHNWRSYLRVIMVANLVYCCLTITAVIYFFDRLTVLGKLYFLVELVLIVAVALIERMTIIRYKKQKSK